MKQLIGSYSQMCDAYVCLSKNFQHKDSSESFSPFKVLNSYLKVATYRPCVITMPPILQPDANYGNGIEDPKGSKLVEKFELHCTRTDGVTGTIIVECKGSDETTFKQVLKWVDDFRKDAIVQQVFAYANRVLEFRKCSDSKRISRSHRLSLATYNVVPLSDRVGVRIFSLR